MKKDDFIKKYNENNSKDDVVDEAKDKKGKLRLSKGFLLAIAYIPGTLMMLIGGLMRAVIPSGSKEIIEIINSTGGIPEDLMGEVRSVEVALKVAPIVIVIGLIINIIVFVATNKGKEARDV